MLSPHHHRYIYKVEAIQRRAIRWVTRDYRYTSSVTAMLNDLNWRALDQRRIDSRLMMMHIYNVTNDLVAIPVSLYLVRNTITSRHIHSLVYKQIQTFKDNYRFIGGRAGGRTDGRSYVRQTLLQLDTSLVLTVLEKIAKKACTLVNVNAPVVATTSWWLHFSAPVVA